MTVLDATISATVQILQKNIPTPSNIATSFRRMSAMTTRRSADVKTLHRLRSQAK
jgi:hypothetical protein